MDILYQIRARQDSFSAGEGRIARLMLDDVGFAASASLEDLAQRAEVSTATLSRFARTVGCRDRLERRLNHSAAFLGQHAEAYQETLRQIRSHLAPKLPPLTPH